MEKEVRKLRKRNKYTYSLTIPKEMIDKYKWREGQKLVIEDKGNGRLQIRDWRAPSRRKKA